MSPSTQGLTVPIVSPVTGTVINLADVPDAVFSSKAVGDGLGGMPADGRVVSLDHGCGGHSDVVAEQRAKALAAETAAITFFHA